MDKDQIVLKEGNAQKENQEKMSIRKMHLKSKENNVSETNHEIG